MAGKESERIIWILVVAIVLVFAVSSLFSMMMGYGYGGMMGPGMMGWGWMGFGWWMLIGPIVGLLFIGLIIYGIYYIFSGRLRSFEPEKRSSLDILKERYAKGEITEDEYRKMKKELE